MTRDDFDVDPRPYPENRNYFVYSDGRIFSCRSRKFLKGRWDGHYIRIRIYINGKAKNKRIGVVVLETFTGPRPNGLVCRHKDGNSKNNHILNLEWSTQLQNIRDTYIHGTRPMGETTGNSKLKNEDIKTIRTMTCCAAAVKFGISRSQASRIINRKSWTHL